MGRDATDQHAVGGEDAALLSLAEAAGLATRWKDAFSQPQRTGPEALRAVLDALGLGARNAAGYRERMTMLEEEDGRLPPLLTGDVGGTLRLPGATGRWRLRLENGAVAEGTLGENGELRLPDVAGYHALEVGDGEHQVAVAPARCFTIADALAAAGGGRTRCWGLAQQLYALRRTGDGGVGDFAALAEFAREAAASGADSVTISPVHAQFSADLNHFSPYSPSSRIMLNVLHTAADGSGDEASGGAGEEAARLERLDLVDWPAVGRERLARLRRSFDAGGARADGFAAWREAEGDKLEAHATFEALHARLWREEGGAWNWREWPAAYRDPGSETVRAFARERADEVAFHAWLQWRANLGLGAAQEAARRAGMAIGLIADLAVGTDAGGSHSWSRQAETLVGLTVGCPPDLLQKDGQNWGITAFSGRGLRANGFRAFIEMLRGTMRHAGGIRIDHAMGLHRIWVVPDGRPASAGAYLQMPERDLIRLVKLESARNQAIVLGEDLGTVPEGFSDRLAEAGIDGMRVLFFEKEGDRFRSPREWTRQASAVTSTHDLATVAGWWQGHDIAVRREIGGDEAQERREQEQRGQERPALWDAFVASGAAIGPMPATWDAWPVVDAAVAQVGLSGCELVVVPTEDVLALEEQPNVPGTIDEHPNWRRRLEAAAGSVLSGERPQARLRRLDRLCRNK